MKFRFNLTLLALLLLLPACDLIMPEPEPPPVVILMLFPGFMEFDPPAVRIASGEHLILKKWPKVWDPDTGPFPELGSGQVRASYRSFFPRVIRCTDAFRALSPFSSEQPLPPGTTPRPCTLQADFYRASRPDSLIRVDESMMEAVARILPCARDANGDPLTPEAWASSGAFGECATWGSAITEAGPGLEVIHASKVEAVGCGSSWVSKTSRDGWRRPWPEPFDGYAKVEVQIEC